MARTDTLPHFLTDVADAIREKGGTSETIQASSFDTAINDLPSGGGADLSEYYAKMGSGSYGGRSSGINMAIKKIPSSLECLGNNLTYAFWKCSSLETIELFDTSNVTNMNYMCADCSNLKNVANLNTSFVNNVSFMFQNCSSLVNAPSIDTQRASSHSYMFQNCSSLQNVPVYNVALSNNLMGMFQGCTSLTNESLNNILYMCSTKTSYFSKTLANLFNDVDMSSYYPASTIQGLSNYTAFTNAGWSIGW